MLGFISFFPWITCHHIIAGSISPFRVDKRERKRDPVSSPSNYSWGPAIWNSSCCCWQLAGRETARARCVGRSAGRGPAWSSLSTSSAAGSQSGPLSLVQDNRGQSGPLSLVQDNRGLVLIGGELHNDEILSLLMLGMPAFSCLLEPARAPCWFFMA